MGEDDFDLGGTRELRIVPILGGSKRAGSLQTETGVVLIAVATINTGGFAGIAASGAWGVVGGVAIAMAVGSAMQMKSLQVRGL